MIIISQIDMYITIITKTKQTIIKTKQLNITMIHSLLSFIHGVT